MHVRRGSRFGTGPAEAASRRAGRGQQERVARRTRSVRVVYGRVSASYVPDIERNRDAYRLRERAQGWDNDIINVPRKGRTHRDKLAPTEITSSRNRTGDRRGGPGRVWIPRSPRLVA